MLSVLPRNPHHVGTKYVHGHTPNRNPERRGGCTHRTRSPTLARPHRRRRIRRRQGCPGHRPRPQAHPRRHGQGGHHPQRRRPPRRHHRRRLLRPQLLHQVRHPAPRARPRLRLPPDAPRPHAHRSPADPPLRRPQELHIPQRHDPRLRRNPHAPRLQLHQPPLHQILRLRLQLLHLTTHLVRRHSRPNTIPRSSHVVTPEFHPAENAKRQRRVIYQPRAKP